MITVYPHNSDWEEIHQITGDDSWAPDHMRGYFERLERCTYLEAGSLRAAGICAMAFPAGWRRAGPTRAWPSVTASSWKSSRRRPRRRSST